MRKFAISLFTLLAINNVFGVDCQFIDNNTVKIPILPKTIPTPTPLSLGESAIEADYHCGVITFTFNTDMGNAHIVVSNLTTGEQWCGGLSGCGSTFVMLSGDSGYYEVVIYTDQGEYYGNFII